MAFLRLAFFPGRALVGRLRAVGEIDVPLLGALSLQARRRVAGR